MIRPPSQAAHSEWIMMGPAHSWCQCASGPRPLSPWQCGNTPWNSFTASSRGSGVGLGWLGAMNTCPIQATSPPAARLKGAGFAGSLPRQKARRLPKRNLNLRLDQVGPAVRGRQARPGPPRRARGPSGEFWQVLCALPPGPSPIWTAQTYWTK
jgi:hypothetical protein